MWRHKWVYISQLKQKVYPVSQWADQLRTRETLSKEILLLKSVIWATELRTVRKFKWHFFCIPSKKNQLINHKKIFEMNIWICIGQGLTCRLQDCQFDFLPTEFANLAFSESIWPTEKNVTHQIAFLPLWRKLGFFQIAFGHFWPLSTKISVYPSLKKVQVGFSLFSDPCLPESL